jgi:hypothetical protein
LGFERVQYARGTAHASPVSSVGITFPSNPTLGDTLIVDCGCSNGSVTSVTGGGVTTWTRAIGNGEFCSIWFGVVDTTPSTSITVNISSSGWTNAVAHACEYPAELSLDKTSSNSFSFVTVGNTRQTGTTDTTAQAEELWIGCMEAYGSTVTLDTPQNSFTLLDGVNFSSGLAVAYLERAVSSAAAAYSGVTVQTANANAGGCIATFVSTEEEPTMISVNDAVAAAEGMLTGKTLMATDAVWSKDGLRLDWALVVGDGVFAAEAVEVGKVDRQTRLFLVLGGVSVQLTPKSSS